MEKEKCKKCGSESIVLVEYGRMDPDYYDGVSEIMCDDCGVRIGRWSGKELQTGENEPKFGQRKK